MFKYFSELLFVVMGLGIIGFNFTFLSEVPLVFSIVNLVGALVAALPPIMIFYSRFRRRKEIEDQFTIFITDLTEAINSGMTLPLALQHVATQDYRALSPHVK